MRPQCVYGYGDCVPQKGGPQGLDVLGDRLMFRLAYRNFGDHESLVLNHTVKADALEGIRWYEVRNPEGDAPSIYQQGTYAPTDSVTNPLSRWMGSVAMDKQGDIALGFSASGANDYPSVRYTGRAAGDAPGQMTQAEQVLYTGQGPQTEAEGRWGDYSELSVDPTDDCTFWYTQEYLTTDTRRDRLLGDAHRLVPLPRLQVDGKDGSAEAVVTMASVIRFPVVLFDLDGTVVDSGAIILASMRHATREVLGRDFGDDELMQAVGGPGLEAQMAVFAPERVDELVRVYRAHNEPLHDELEACAGMEDVLVRLHAEGRRLGVVTAKRRSTVELAFAQRAARPSLRDRRRRRRDREAQARSGAAAPRAEALNADPPRPPTSATRRSTSAPRRRRACMRSPSRGGASTTARGSSGGAGRDRRTRGGAA